MLKVGHGEVERNVIEKKFLIVPKVDVYEVTFYNCFSNISIINQHDYYPFSG